jgi:phosphoribosylglycinamide formyltransferase-1
MTTSKQILLFASGGGSNVTAILNYFKHKDEFCFPLVISNNPEAGVIDIARSHKIDVMLIDKSKLNSEVILDTFDDYKPDLIVLAGFLLKIPDFFVRHYSGKIVNIHPSLLPMYGGKGMYGHHVHEAVIANQDAESGITIHLVNEQYDEGTILLQKRISISPEEGAVELAKKVLQLEHEWYSQVIESMLKFK